MATMTAGHAVADTLAKLGVRRVIGMAGSCMIEILDGMYGREDISFLTVRHEQSAALMADAYARLSGEVGVCMATNGPGATNLVTGVAHSMMAQSPVLVITGAPMMKDTFRDSAQELDQVAMFAPMVKWSVQVRKPERAADVIREAFHVATSGVPGPVHVDLPRDVMNERADYPENGLGRPPRARLSPGPEEAAKAAALLGSAERPLLLGGGGVLWDAASEDLIALAEALDAPIMTSTGRDDLVPNQHPLFLGSVGRGTLPEARALFGRADVVFAVGTRLAHTSTFLKPDFFGQARLIHAAVDPKNIGRNFPTEVGMNADAGPAIRGVLAELGERAARPAWRAEAEEVRAAQEKHRERALEYGGKPIDPRRAQMALARVLPENTIITNDAGSAAGYLYEYQRFDHARNLVAPQDLAAIGIGYPLGLGAKLARPAQKVVTISGDGAFLCNGAELETAVRENLPTVCVVLNNFNLGSERAYQKHFYDGRYIADAIGNPRFDEYARVFGAAGYRAEDPEELEDVYAQALAEEGPVIVDVIIDQDVFPEPRRKDAVRERA